MNIYRGCTHGCIYCDSRSKCYQMAHDFEDIEIKKNAVQILESQLRRKRKKCMISTGAMCDPYIPLEKKMQITRQCLKLIENYRFGIAIQTKSNLILRDLDILKRIHAKTKCVVQLTITTYDQNLCKIIEPNVATTLERFKVLQIMRDEGIPTVVWLAPVLPFINDTEENLYGILDYCFRAKVYAVLNFGFGLTLREGNREYFYRMLDRYFPNLKNKYLDYYGDAYECNSPNNSKLQKILYDECYNKGVLLGANKIFDYLSEFEARGEQLKLF